MVKVQKKNQLFRNCALVLRYVPRDKYAIADRFYDSDKYYRLIKLV